MRLSTPCGDCDHRLLDHWLVKASSTLEVLLSLPGTPSLLSPFFSQGSRVVAQVSAPLTPLLLRGMGLVGLVSYGSDGAHICTKRSRVVWEEAERRGIPLRQIFIAGLPTELLEAHIQGALRVFDSLPVPPRYRTGALWASDKFALKKKLRDAGVAAPVARTVSTLRAARKAFRDLGVVCVKPRSGSNGYHTFPHVATEADLVQAFRSAKKLCTFVVVEEHLEGSVARATCVNGELVGFLESCYPTVTGDGRSTVRELVEKENKLKPSGVADIVLTSIHERYIARRGYARDSVLAVGQKLPLVYWAGYNSGGRNKEFGTAINPELKAEIERAARLTELPVVGFDLIIEDPLQSPTAQKWGIIEANSRPWIDLHASPLYGTPVNVAGRLWDLWE